MGVTDDVLREKGKKKKKKKKEEEEEWLKESSVSLWNVLGKTKGRKE